MPPAVSLLLQHSGGIHRTTAANVTSSQSTSKPPVKGPSCCLAFLFERVRNGQCTITSHRQKPEHNHEKLTDGKATSMA